MATVLGLGVLCVCLLGIYVLLRKRASRPKPLIFTYWEGGPSPTVDACWARWNQLHPGRCVMITPDTVSQWCPELVKSGMLGRKNIAAHRADLIRVYVISKYGGIWTDASIWPMQCVDDWIPDVPFVAFHQDAWKNETNSVPIVENWFFAAKKSSKFLHEWRKEFTHPTKDPPHVDLSGISPDSRQYLAQHVAAQIVLQTQPELLSELVVGPACKKGGPFEYLAANDWKSEKGLQALATSHKPGSLVKFRGVERNALDKDDALRASVFTRLSH